MDRASESLRGEWDRRARPNLEFRGGDARALPLADGEHDLAAAVEVLEHLHEPERALAELTRVARRHILVSVPREPIWRAANLTRGAHVRSLGSTPGHVNRWSPGAFASLVERFGTIEAARSPFPWTVLLVRLRGASERADRGATLDGAATWRSGYAAACKAVYPGSILGVALDPADVEPASRSSAPCRTSRSRDRQTPS